MSLSIQQESRSQSHSSPHFMTNSTPNRSTSQSSETGSSGVVGIPAHHPGSIRGAHGHRHRRGGAEFVPYITQPARRSENASLSTNTEFTQNSLNRGFDGHNTSHAHQHNTMARRPRSPVWTPSVEWMQWQEVGIRVRRLPPSITTWDLWEAFKSKGTITCIEIYTGGDGSRDGTAKVRFSPPPRKNFWVTGTFQFRASRKPPASDIAVVADVSLAHSTRKFQVQSPVRKHVFYPEVMKLFPSTMDFGIMIDQQTMMMMRSAPSLIGQEVIFQVDLLRRKLVIYFPCHFSKPKDQEDLPAGSVDLDRINYYMIWIPFEQIEKIYSVELDANYISFVLSLDSPPCFYRKRADIKASHIEEANLWTEMDTWYRQTDIIYNPIILRNKPVTLNTGEVEIDIGRWTTYRFVMNKNAINSPSLFKSIYEALKDFNIPVQPLENFKMVPRMNSTFWGSIDHQAHTSLDELALIGQDNYELPFEIRYQLEVCISQGVFLEHNLTSEFLAALRKLSRENSAKARTILEYFTEMETRVHDPMSIFGDEEAQGRAIRAKIPPYCAYVRKATVTPSGIYFSTPTVETSNRVIRHFSDLGDRFLRVQFTDEKTEGRISSNADKVKDNELYTRVFRTLRNGIVIGDRKYEFLAYGNSQFRQNGAYFFCPTGIVSCNHIRAWMGDFRHLKVVAKYAARLGQCFSTTRAIQGGANGKIGKIQDVERNGYTFTDGVGKISYFLAQIIASQLGLPLAAHVPSAFQFRLGGCKGILAVWPDMMETHIEIRSSQSKFEAVYNGLEIIRCSQFSTATLNRQTITILSALGVNDNVFTDMLAKQLSGYQLAMTDKPTALTLLQRWIDENQMTITIASMILSGFMESREPFIMSLLHLWRAWSIKLLKEKAKIMVEEGALVLGCIDETSTLKGHSNIAKPIDAEGKPNEDDLPEIFIQVPEPGGSGKYKIIEGVCLVGRNPSLHCGDIRIVKAVNIPALRHLRDVVVFPQLGDRDIPSMCSGGDLDGDDFFVIWDKNLVPVEWNVTPMNYDAPEVKEKPNGPVVIEDLMKFFVVFMKNDSLPTIAHAHLAQSDRLDRGVKDPVCLKLAELHSKAVDYVKSGEAAVMPKSLRPRKWPHFMEKKYKPKEQIYTSTRILGLLYDQIEAVDFVPQYTESFDKRILRAYKLDSEMLKSARQIKTQYDTAVKRIMAQMEIKTEFEIYTTFILSKPRVGSDYKMQEEMSGISDSLKDRFRTACIEAAGGSKDFVKLAPFVAAMYQVTWEEMQIALSECRDKKTVGGKEVPKRKMLPKFMPLMSFPWIFHEILGRIVAGRDAQDKLEELGMAILRPGNAGLSRKKRVTSEEIADSNDFVETEEGITHRGELLDLFRPDENSDTEDGTDADTESISEDKELNLSRNTRSRNREIDARKLDSAGYIAPHDDAMDDDFMGVELDGFLNPSRDIRPVSSSRPVYETSTHRSTILDHPLNARPPIDSTSNFEDLKDIVIAAKPTTNDNGHISKSLTGHRPSSIPIQTRRIVDYGDLGIEQFDTRHTLGGSAPVDNSTGLNTLVSGNTNRDNTSVASKDNGSSLSSGISPSLSNALGLEHKEIQAKDKNKSLGEPGKPSGENQAAGLSVTSQGGSFSIQPYVTSSRNSYSKGEIENRGEVRGGAEQKGNCDDDETEFESEEETIDDVEDSDFEKLKRLGGYGGDEDEGGGVP